MSKTLYLSNLPFSMTQTQIHDLFSQVGIIRDVRIITDPFTDLSNGTGYVQMITEKAAQDAITRFDGYVLQGRLLAVSEARSYDEISETVGGVAPKNNAAGGNRL